MKKVLILLLVTLVQSQSYGIVLSSSYSDDHFQDSQLEDWDATDSPYQANVIKEYDLNFSPFKKRSVITSDVLTRRSALDKNFMRFGRGGDGLRKNCEDGKLSFYRFGRSLKDGFIRFGRGGGGGKDGFIRFGRSRPEDFFRAGKSLRENFIRFGKADKNFVRFGRENAEEGYQDVFPSEKPFQRLGKSSRAQENFMRLGKSGKNGKNFLKFGKSYPESGDEFEGDQDSNIPKEMKRKRRDAREELIDTSSKSESKRSTEFFEKLPNVFQRRNSPALVSSLLNLENLRNSRLTPFFPVYLNHAKSFKLYESKAQKNQGEKML